jgi:hypothetical protein
LGGGAPHYKTDSMNDSQNILQVSAQYGDGFSKAAVRPFHKTLNQIFESTLRGKYFRSIETLSIVFRVAGKIWKFDGEGPERVKLLKQSREITVDLIIPEGRWRDLPPAQLRDYLDGQIRQCFQVLLSRARRADELINEESLVNDFEAAMIKFSTYVA